MSSQDTPNQSGAAELPGSPVSWWSEAIFLGTHSSVRAIKIAVLADQGWKRAVRLCLVQNGTTHPPVTLMMLQSNLYIKLIDLGPVDFKSDFSPVLSLEFEFGHPEDGEPGKPRVVLIEQPPIFKVKSASSIQGPDQGLLLSRGNELKVKVRESFLPFMLDENSPGPFPIEIEYSPRIKPSESSER